jgi:V-type H+-transporting ATPase subunit a
MMLGIVISSTNYIYFKKKIDFIFSFIPQILFLSSIFGYMCILIVTKWLIQWPTGDAPRLLNLMIEMLLTPWQLSPKFIIYEYQHQVQMILVVIAVVCVPVMLFPKPIILWILNRRKQRAHFVDDSEIELSDLSKTNDNLIEEEEEEEEDIEHGEHVCFLIYPILFHFKSLY